MFFHFQPAWTICWGSSGTVAIIAFQATAKLNQHGPAARPTGPLAPSPRWDSLDVTIHQSHLSNISMRTTRPSNIPLSLTIFLPRIGKYNLYSQSLTLHCNHGIEHRCKSHDLISDEPCNSNYNKQKTNADRVRHSAIFLAQTSAMRRVTPTNKKRKQMILLHPNSRKDSLVHMTFSVSLPPYR